MIAITIIIFKLLLWKTTTLYITTFICACSVLSCCSRLSTSNFGHLWFYEIRQENTSSVSKENQLSFSVSGKLCLNSFDLFKEWLWIQCSDCHTTIALISVSPAMIKMFYNMLQNSWFPNSTNKIFIVSKKIFYTRFMGQASFQYLLSLGRMVLIIFIPWLIVSFFKCMSSLLPELCLSSFSQCFRNVNICCDCSWACWGTS